MAYKYISFLEFRFILIHTNTIDMYLQKKHASTALHQHQDGKLQVSHMRRLFFMICQDST